MRRRRRVVKRKSFITRIKEYFQRIGTLNIILMLVGAFFVWFNWQMILMFRECGSIPETYACAVVTATIGECGICGWIRTNKDRKMERKWEKEDKEEQEKHDKEGYE